MNLLAFNKQIKKDMLPQLPENYHFATEKELDNLPKGALVTYMTQKEKRIKLAEAEGYKFEWADNANGDGPTVITPHWRAPGDNRLVYHLPTMPPDYFESLDACHQLENKLNGDNQLRYITHLRLIAAKKDDLKTIHWFAVLNSPPEDKAEALGRTLELW